MTTEKFESEVEILNRFFTIYCHDKKHTNIISRDKNIIFEDKTYTYTLNLCDECFDLLGYSCSKLIKCPYDTKPRCRTCATPCYDKVQWKQVAKRMRYAGIKQGINKVKGLFTNG